MKTECNIIQNKLLKKSKKSLIALFSTLSIVSFTAFAGGPDHMTMPSEQLTQAHPWSAIISAGYTNYSNMYSNDGQTAIAGLAINRSIFARNNWLFGIEAGVQTGNTMRLEENQAIFNLLGVFAPVSTTEKPILDLTATLKKSFVNSPFFLEGKAGIAYRRWQFDNINSVNDLSQVGFEAQAGAGYHINHRTDLSLLYQGIFGGNPHLTANGTTGTGIVSNIPTQNGILLSLSHTV